MRFQFCLAFAALIILPKTAVAVVDIDTGGKGVNCHLTQTSNFVKDSSAMSDKAASKEDCLARCEKYAQESVVSMADSDTVTKLEWSCFYPDNKQKFHTKKIKG